MQLDRTLVLETSRFTLRISDFTDIPFIISATEYKGFNDGMLWEPPKNQEEVRASLHRNLRAFDAQEAFAFTIVEKETKIRMGRISVRKTKSDAVWSVGFWTHPKKQGKGVMTETLKRILRFAFENLMAERVEASHAKWNGASEKVMIYNGMKFEKYIEKGFKKRGKWVDENLLAIDKQRWQTVQNPNRKR